MCGIFGWQWKKDKMPSYAQRAVLAVMLAVGNDKRGGHSWGVWTPSGVRRALGKAAPRLRPFASESMLFGHTRYATHGSTSKKNAHPFTVSLPDGHKLTGAHNGIIYNHYELNKKYERKFEVDSQHIFKHLAEELPLTELTGYGTAQYARTDSPERIYLAKLTAGGELSVVETMHGLVWSSDYNHLELALECAGVEEIDVYKLEAGIRYFAEAGEFWKESSEPVMAINPSAKTDKRTSGGDTKYGWWRGGSVESTQLWDMWDEEKGKWKDDSGSQSAAKEDEGKLDANNLPHGLQLVTDEEDGLSAPVAFDEETQQWFVSDVVLGTEAMLPEDLKSLDDYELSSMLDMREVRSEPVLYQLLSDEMMARENNVSAKHPIGITTNAAGAA